jgi:sugar phosphate isomerase/epimerase
MKLSIAIADKNALPSAFVVYRGFDESIAKSAQMVYHGVELALKRADEIHPDRLHQLLENTRMEVSCISTGQVYADRGLMLTHANTRMREETIAVFREMIDLAHSFGRIVNIGRVRGTVGDRNRQEVEEIFTEVARELCNYAAPRGVSLILEPVNRYETDFINSVSEGVALMKKVDRANMFLMPDLFHMNIEDPSIGGELVKHIDFVKYIHVADSNRLAPGQGHIDFTALFKSLFQVQYNSWLSVEILPSPTPDIAARQAAEYLLPLIKSYNRQQLAVES